MMGSLFSYRARHQGLDGLGAIFGGSGAALLLTVPGAIFRADGSSMANTAMLGSDVPE